MWPPSRPPPNLRDAPHLLPPPPTFEATLLWWTLLLVLYLTFWAVDRQSVVILPDSSA